MKQKQIKKLKIKEDWRDMIKVKDIQRQEQTAKKSDDGEGGGGRI